MSGGSSYNPFELERILNPNHQGTNHHNHHHDERSMGRHTSVHATTCLRPLPKQRLLFPSIILNIIFLAQHLFPHLHRSCTPKDFSFDVPQSTWTPPSGLSSPQKTTSGATTPLVSNITSYTPYPKIFGHIHVAKTAGTDINGELAAHYERVCGHKGYSYDAVQFNERVKTRVQSTGITHLNKVGGPDLISFKYKNFNRGRIIPEVMREIGFEDCDYISLESPWETWKEITPLGPVELHVPCRDPLDHVMSQCNHRGVDFSCDDRNTSTDTALWDQIDACLIGMNRFDFLLTRIDQLQLKCFTPIPINPYLEYMDQYLQRKRIQTSYIRRTSNTPRIKSAECIWKNTALADRVVKYLKGYDYYRWCHECLGTENDLLRPAR